MRCKNQKNSLLVLLTVVMGISILSTGCEPLRKKFTRKKKEDAKRDFIPVLDPIDYPAKVTTCVDVYKQNYSLWRVWHKDLANLLYEPSINEKRIRGLFAEITGKLGVMGSCLQGDTQAALERELSVVHQLRRAFEQPVVMRDIPKLRRDIERSLGKITKEFSPKNVEDSLRVQLPPDGES
jgi:hypothetical protein